MTEKKQPLWLPEGSVRAVITLASVGGAIAGLLSGNIQAIQVLVPIATACIGYYFGWRPNTPQK